MKLDAIVSQMNSHVVAAESNLQAALKLDSTNNPTAMLQMQYALQQYSMVIGFESTMIKAIKDMMSGILAKM